MLLDIIMDRWLSMDLSARAYGINFSLDSLPSEPTR
jgi:hypothetical protein